MINWKKPQKYINNFVVFFSVLSLILSLCWLALYYVWMHQPDVVIKYGNKVPKKYLTKINELQALAEKSENQTEQVKHWQDILVALDGVTSIGVHYQLYSQTLTKLIDHWQKNKQQNLALDAAENWQKNYPYDFNAKFKYHQLLRLKNDGSALKYSAELYEQFKDIDPVNSRYFSDLLNNGDFDQALQVARYQELSFVNNTMPRFVVYYKDQSYERFHEDTKVDLPLTQYQISGQHYQVKMQRKYNQLRGLRLDIDQIRVNSTIKNVTVALKSPHSTYNNLVFKVQNHLNKIADNSFITTGSDPYFEIILPQQVLNSEEPIELTVSLEIVYQEGYVINELIKHNDWKVYYAKTHHQFDEENAKSFRPTLVQGKEKYHISSSINIPKKNYQSFRVDFPGYQNFSAYDLKVSVNGESTLSIKDIDQLRGVEKSDQGELIVTNNDPFIIFTFDSPIEIEQLDLELALGKKDESI